jgi:hypothetical protein
MKSSVQSGLLFGRRQELARLTAAIRERRSLLIFGPPDSGKSALVDQALANLPKNLASRCLRVKAEGSLQRTLQQQVIRLFAAKDATVEAAFPSQAAGSQSVESWVKKQTSGRLRSVLFRAFDAGRYWIFWDNIGQLGLAHYHFLREVIWMRKTPVYLLARGLGYEYLGQAGRLFWSHEWRVELGPLVAEDARALLEAAIKREGITNLDLSEFHEQVLEASRGLPGAIVRMVAMAGQPQYRYGNKVKTKLIHIDYLVQLASRVQV